MGLIYDHWQKNWEISLLFSFFLAVWGFWGKLSKCAEILTARILELDGQNFGWPPNPEVWSYSAPKLHRPSLTTYLKVGIKKSAKNSPRCDCYRGAQCAPSPTHICNSEDPPFLGLMSWCCQQLVRVSSSGSHFGDFNYSYSSGCRVGLNLYLFEFICNLGWQLGGVSSGKGYRNLYYFWGKCGRGRVGGGSSENYCNQTIFTTIWLCLWT